MRRLWRSLFALVALAACEPETTTDFPQDISSPYKLVPPGKAVQPAAVIPPGKKPVQTVRMPCRVLVLNNGIYGLSKPWSGSERRDKPYPLGAILTAEKVSGEWVYVSNFMANGWIHKDNLRPLPR